MGKAASAARFIVVQRAGIGLEGDFRVVKTRKEGDHLFPEPPKLFTGEQRGSAPADINAVQGARNLNSSLRALPRQRREIPVHQRIAGIQRLRREIAVAALAHAERDVHIETEMVGGQR